jgi:hypothetical protein
VVIDNGDEVPMFIYEALGISAKREEFIGKLVRKLEKEGVTVADAILELLNNKKLTKKEKVYAAYRLGERQTEHTFETIFTSKEMSIINQIGGACLELEEK